jgi:hypothetical protein
MGLAHKMTYNSLTATPNSLRFWETHQIYVFYICSNFSSIDDDHKELSFSKETDFKTEAKTLDI